MSLEHKILQITKPTIKVDEMSIIDRESNTDNQVISDSQVKPSEFMGFFIPFVIINGYEYTTQDILSLELNVSDFVPILKLRLLDNNTLFQGRHFPRDGDVVSLLIKPHDRKKYKDVRIDFDILSVIPNLGNKLNNILTFNITGQMKVPGLFGEVIKSFPSISSYDCLLQVSQDLSLGFATNVEDTKDVMTWINPNNPVIDFIEETTMNSYKDDESFFVSFIDQWYNLNLVNINSIFTVDGDLEESEIFLRNMPQLAKDSKEGDGATKSYFYLTNLQSLQGTSKYITYRMINNSGDVFLTNGYKRYAQFFNILDDPKNGNFISEYVDPLTTKGSDSLVHLKGRYIGDIDKRKPEGVIDKQIKYKYLGKQTKNVHENYLYSSILNYQNREEILKMGMIVDMVVADLTITKYQRVLIAIYDYGEREKEVYDKDRKNMNDEEDGATRNNGRLNSFLSGWYVVIGIEYLYSFPGPIRQRLTLVKREFSPVS